MSRFGRVPRRPDHWASGHERARARAAERMAGVLEPVEAAWLEDHLLDCPACAAVVAAYDADRVALRALRDAQPEPPRDLWARTAAAIERESGSASPVTESGRRSRYPLGALSGLAVIVVVLGATALSGVWSPLPHGTLQGDEASLQGGQPVEVAPSGTGRTNAGPTPIAVDSEDVAWVERDLQGGLAYNHVLVDEVCPTASSAGCPVLRESQAAQAFSMSATPRTFIGSPTHDRAVAIADDGADGDQLLLVVLPQADPSTRPQPSPVPSASTTASPAASDEPATSDDPIATQTTSASSQPSPSITASAAPSISPEPTIATNLAIASGIEVVGESAAFSADGRWFAFTARPSDGSTGPDVYVWKTGDEKAHAITSDGASYFASWDGSRVVASRPAGSNGNAHRSDPETVRIDPSTGTERAAGDLWRPVVDPTRSRAIGWAGSITTGADPATWKTDTGRLELRAWSDRDRGTGQALDGAAIGTDEAGDFDIRWDETGEWVAVWVADRNDPAIGRLSLYRIDASTDELEQPEGSPAEVVALPGFSIGKGRLAWATPPGQGGEGSTIQIVAWSTTNVGKAESVPGEDLIVIR